VFFLSTEWKGGSERECWGGIVTVISIQYSSVFFFVSQVKAGWCEGGTVGVGV